MNLKLRGAVFLVLLGAYVAVHPGREEAAPLKDGKPEAPTWSGEIDRQPDGQLRAPASSQKGEAKADSGKFDDRSRVVRTQAELRRLRKCWKENTCGFPEDDPRSAHFAAAAEISKALRSLQSITDPEAKKEIASIAREWVRFPEDHVREAALELIARLEHSGENLQAVLDGMGGSYSAPLFTQGLPILADFAGRGFSDKVTEFLVSRLTNGSLRVAETVAAGIGPFLSDANVERFRAAADGLPTGSRVRRDLESELEEFRLAKQGG